jgi:hypothetical protein
MKKREKERKREREKERKREREKERKREREKERKRPIPFLSFSSSLPLLKVVFKEHKDISIKLGYYQ